MFLMYRSFKTISGLPSAHSRSILVENNWRRPDRCIGKSVPFLYAMRGVHKDAMQIPCVSCLPGKYGLNSESSESVQIFQVSTTESVQMHASMHAAGKNTRGSWELGVIY